MLYIYIYTVFTECDHEEKAWKYLTYIRHLVNERNALGIKKFCNENYFSHAIYSFKNEVFFYYVDS